MSQLIFCAFVLLIASSSYKNAKRQGVWRWGQFFAVIGSMAVFIAVFIVPLSYSSWMEKRPGLLVTVMLSGIFLFVGTLVYVLRRKSMMTTASKE